MNRGGVWANALVAGLAYVATIWAVHRWIVRALLPWRELSIAVSFAVVQTAAIALMLIVLFVRKWIAARRAAQSAEIQSDVQDALAAESIGQDQLRPLRSLLSRSRRDVEAGVGSFLATVRGRPYERIVAVSRKLGIAVPDDPDRLEKQFAAAVTGSLLTRAAAIEELEPFAGQVANQQLARALRTDDVQRVLAALDMLYAWKRMLPIGDFERLLRHGNPEVRFRAFRALPYAGVQDGAASLLEGLRDADPRVRVAAANTAGRLHVREAAGLLAASVSDAPHDVGVSAAFALAQVEGGRRRLEAISNGTDRAAAAVAFEALEKATLSRLEVG